MSASDLPDKIAEALKALIDKAAKAVAQEFLTRTDTVTSDTHQVRALKAYQKVVNLATEQLDRSATNTDWTRPRRTGFAA